jgi:hypothetical protein
MMRFHVHVAVENLVNSIRFYSYLFGAKPTVKRPDYAKWTLADPRVNFAILSRGHKPGVNHLGFQAEDATELAELAERASHASGAAALKEDVRLSAATRRVTNIGSSTRRGSPGSTFIPSARRRFSV